VVPVVPLLLGAEPVDLDARDRAAELEALAATVGSLRLKPAAVTLGQAGAEPRSVVRYHLRPGASSTMESTMRLAFGGTMTLPDGRSMPLPLPGGSPAVVTTLKSTVGAAAADGLVPVRFEQLGARVEGTSSEAARTAQAAVANLGFDLVVDAAGSPVRVDVVGAEDPRVATTAQQLADQLVNRLPAFPAEPIGLGASWTVDDDLQVAGMVLQVTSTYTLTGLRGDTADLDLTLAARLEGGGLAVPGLPPGVKPVVERFDGSGSGELQVDLTSLGTTGTVDLQLDPKVAVALMPGSPPMSLLLSIHQATELRRL
jgi:hypothetical protein